MRFAIIDDISGAAQANGRLAIPYRYHFVTRICNYSSCLEIRFLIRSMFFKRFNPGCLAKESMISFPAKLVLKFQLVAFEGYDYLKFTL